MVPITFHQVEKFSGVADRWKYIQDRDSHIEIQEGCYLLFSILLSRQMTRNTKHYIGPRTGYTEQVTRLYFSLGQSIGVGYRCLSPHDITVDKGHVTQDR